MQIRLLQRLNQKSQTSTSQHLAIESNYLLRESIPSSGIFFLAWLLGYMYHIEYSPLSIQYRCARVSRRERYIHEYESWEHLCTPDTIICDTWSCEWGDTARECHEWPWSYDGRYFLRFWVLQFFRYILYSFYIYSSFFILHSSLSYRPYQ